MLMIKMGTGRVIGVQRGMKKKVGRVGLVSLCRGVGCWDCITGIELYCWLGLIYDFIDRHVTLWAIYA